jgi:phosphate transport system protein
MDLLESNINLLAIYHPVASDLRFMIMLSRTAYDLERIHQEALRLVDLAEAHQKHRNPMASCEIFDDVGYLADIAYGMLADAMSAVTESSADIGLKVARRPPELERLAEGALRRLATYIMQDPRVIQSVIDATVALKGLERVADHAVSIARNVILAVSGKDVRHLNSLNLDRAFLRI